LAVTTEGSIIRPRFDDEAGLDLAGLTRVLWRAKWVLVGCIALTCALAINIVLWSTGTFTAQMVVQSAGQQSATGAAGAIVHLGSLLGAGTAIEDREFSQFQALLKSAALAERLQNKHGMMQQVFASQWDPVNKRWLEPTGWRHELSAKLRNLRGLPRWIPPSVYDLVDHIGTSVMVKKSSTGGSIYTILYKSGDRDFAIRFLDLLHKETEAALREDRKLRVSEQARYLRSRIETTPIVEYRLSLIQLLSDQDKTLMLLESSLPFATNVVDPPHAPLRPEAPSLIIYGFVGVVGGLVLGVLLVLIYTMVRQAFRGHI
jgi:LPS O-antigen subunit length determinant protein (WzzB/FepE family)